METAPLDRDVWLFGLAEIWVGSCPFLVQGQGGYDPEMDRWVLCFYNDKGETLFVEPKGWQELPLMSE
jgi:hypothetical protein